MNQHLQKILNLIGEEQPLTAEQKLAIVKSLKDADKELEINAFKLDRTEKVKRTTSILLEETIEELEQKRKAVEESNSALTKSLQELKAAQTQLIHAEKMASLGELTAGIAHEIQNPLNFVNNFSDVSIELLNEMKEELDNGKKVEAKEIADDVIGNLEKILFHGKRADDIVKGMLLHSRNSSGLKEPTDINKLTEEYVRLAFHGFRAKDNMFHAKFETDFDPAMKHIKVVSQDLGRVLLNLLNNAFYTVDEKEKASNSPGKYEPVVKVQTRQQNDTVIISVTDNGNGIDEELTEKIFQPFFTTKPTGQGTGLGLSLSYEIIKAQGGEIKVKSKKGEGTEFIVQLPVE